MTVENFTYITSLDPAHPDGTEPKSEGDNHIAGIKTAVKNSFPAISGAVTATHTELNVLDGITATVAELNILDGVTATAAELNALDGITSTVTELNYTDGVTSAIQTQIDAKAPSLSPTFTGTPAGPTATAGTATTQIATTAFVTSAIADAGISGGLPVQTGNARKVLSTDGSAYSLQYPGLVLLATATASSSATVDFTTLIDSTFEEYELHCIYVIPATDTAALWLRTSANAGSSWDSGASDYDTDSGAAGGAQVRLAASCENTVADGGFSGVIRIYNPADTTHNKRINWNYSNYNSSGTLITATSAARRVATTAITGLRVLFSSGNIAEGKFKLYGVKKS